MTEREPSRPARIVKQAATVGAPAALTGFLMALGWLEADLPSALAMGGLIGLAVFGTVLLRLAIGEAL